MNFILWLLTGTAVAGLTGLVRSRPCRQRFVVDTGFAVAGALLGGACAAALGVTPADVAWPGAIAAAAGALVLLAIGNLHMLRSARA